MTELVTRLLQRSEGAIRAAERAVEADDPETAANRAYYAMFYAASALLAADGVAVRRHSAIPAAFGERFVKSGRVDPSLHRSLLASFDLRQLADYDPMATLTTDGVRPTIGDARGFLASARSYLDS
jgi:uncharacterized protein (UPF0332 family)